MNKIHRRTLLAAIACLTVVAAAIHAQADPVYRWVDKGGQVHYSSTPPAATTGIQAKQVKVAAPQVVSVVAPNGPKFVPQDTRHPSADNGMDKAKQDAIDRQIRGTWGDFTDALVCEGLERQIDDLRNGISPNPVTHTTLTAAERDAREQALESQKKRDCP